MKIEPSKIISIKEKFALIQTRKDLLALLNEVKPLIFGENNHLFQLKQLTWYASPKLQVKRYHEFAIRKKSGGDRKINAPVEGLKAIQKVLAVILQCVHEPHPSAMGFTMGRSIYDNASVHVGSRYVFNIDLKDFFPSVDQARVWKCLQIKPFLLINHLESEERPPENIQYRHFNVIARIDENKTKKPHEINFSIKGKNISVGTKSIKLKSDELVYFKVTKNNENEEYDIKIFLWRSNYEIVRAFVEREYKDEKNDFDIMVLHILARVVINSIVKSSIKDHRGNLANLIASICCTQMDVERRNEKGEWENVTKNVLPQGAPTSPVITNIVCRRLDHILSGVSKRFGLKYSRYADDITFSSMHNVYQPEGEFIKEVNRVIGEQGFHIKDSKTRLQKDGHRKEVTGLLVNDKVNVQKRYIKKLRMWLYFWEKYGYEKANDIFMRDYMRDGKLKYKTIPSFVNVLSGKLEYLKMIRGVDDKTYLTIYEKFKRLCDFPQTDSNREEHLDKVVDLLFKEGIDRAMEFFKPVNIES